MGAELQHAQQPQQAEHPVFDISLYKVDIAFVLANSCLFTHPADSEQNYDLFGVTFVSTYMYNVIGFNCNNICIIYNISNIFFYYFTKYYGF